MFHKGGLKLECGWRVMSGTILCFVVVFNLRVRYIIGSDKLYGKGVEKSRDVLK